MMVYLLWFNEWEANSILGIFETREQAEYWKNYFIKNPFKNFYINMTYYSKKETDWIDRFVIEECEVGKLAQHIKIDNLKLLEQRYDEKG